MFINILPFIYFIIAICFFSFLLTSIVIVPERNFYTTTLFGGKYYRTLTSGINFKWPTPIEKVDKKRSTIIEQFKLTPTSITKDKAQLSLDVTIQYKADQDRAYESAYALENPIEQIRSYIENTMRSEINAKTIDQVFASTNEFESAIKEQLEGQFTQYGFIIVNVLVDQPRMSDALTDAYQQKIYHERLKDAAEAEGETTKVKRLKDAEGNKAALTVTGDAYVEWRDKISKGNSDAINTFLKNVDDPQNSLTPLSVLDFFNKINEFETIKEVAKNGGKIVYVVNGNNEKSNSSTSIIPQVIGASEAAKDQISDKNPKLNKRIEKDHKEEPKQETDSV